MQNLKLKISGMSCGACVNHVTNALQNVPGVSGTVVDMKDAYASVEGENLDFNQIKSAIEEQGYGVQLA